MSLSKLRQAEILELLFNERELNTASPVDHTTTTPGAESFVAETSAAAAAVDTTQFDPGQSRRQQGKLRSREASSSAAVPPVYNNDKNNDKNKDNGGTKDSSTLSQSFPRLIYDVLEEGKYPEVMRWCDGGQAFHLNQDHPMMTNVLQTYFKINKFFSWYRKLNVYGWTKVQSGEMKNLMYNKYFWRGMNGDDFRAIVRNEKQKKAKAMAAEAKIKKKNTVREKPVPPKKPTATASKKKKTKPVKTPTVVKTKVKRTAKSTTSTKKRMSGGVVSLITNKKRNRRTLPLASDKIGAKTAKKTTTTRKKQPSTDNKEDKRAKTRLREYKRLYDTFLKWDSYNFPDGLDRFLESGKVLKNNPSKSINASLTVAADADAEPDAHHDKTQEEINDNLLCDEEMPDSVMDNKDDKRALADFVIRIQKDRLQKEKLKKLWSTSVVPIVKGKNLGPAKFKRPTDKWKKVKVGDRIGVYWRDDASFYDAIVRKQQENTNYFHVVYEDDKAQEWLDLSREDFKIRDPGCVNTSNQSRPTSQPIDLPNSHSHLTPFVRRSWKGLGLGRDAGTPAYNAFVRERDASAGDVTALEILSDVRALHSRAFSGIPPPESNETKHPDNTSGSNDDGDSNDKKIATSPNQKATNRLRYLEEKISNDTGMLSTTEHFNRTVHAVRKLTDNWTIPVLRENLRTIESEVLKLNEREAIVLERCKAKGLC